MNIAIRVDASDKIGTGHVMRCLTLAEELRRQGSKIRFICRANPGHMANMIAREGFNLSFLPQPEQALQNGTEQEDYDAWLGVTQEKDAKQTINALGTEPTDWLIVDHYGLDRQWEVKLRPHVHNIMVIDDLANRPHDCDLLLDQNFSLNPENRYSNLVPEQCRRLLCPRYALLRPEYAQYRQTMNQRTGEIKRVLVFMGGSDSADITGMALDALSVQELAHLEVDVVVGANNPHKDKIAKQVKNRPNTNLYGSRPHLADLMSWADLAIGGGGVTTWERMCLGLYSIVICVAENQRPACEALSQAGLIHYLGFWKDVTAAALAENIIDLFENQELLHFQAKACQAMVDGLGAKRIAEVLYPSSNNDLYLRPAREEDALIYYDWVNDPVVRKNAFNPEPISLNTHLDWFEKRMAEPDTYMFVLMAKDLPVGQVRFELQGYEAEIHYSIDELVRGRGWGIRLVKLGVTTINNIVNTAINAKVKKDNKVSSTIFIRLGFEKKFTLEKGLRLFRLDPTRLESSG